MPLPGTNILVKGTKIGTQTDFDGNYEIKAEVNQTLIFSYLSYYSKEIILSNISNEINISMEPDASVLGEIIVAGGVSMETFYYKDISTSSIKERKEYNQKVKSYNKLKAERKKAARLQKRSQKKDK